MRITGEGMATSPDVPIGKAFFKPDSPRRVAATAKRLQALGVNTKGMSYQEAKRAARVVGRKQRLASQGVPVDKITNKQSKVVEVVKPVQDAASDIQRSASKVTTDAAASVNSVADNAASKVTPQKVAMRAGAKGAALAGGALAVGGAAKGIDSLVDRHKEKKMGMKPKTGIKKNSLFSAMEAGLEDIEKRAALKGLPAGLKLRAVPIQSVKKMPPPKAKDAVSLRRVKKSDTRTNTLGAATGVAGGSAAYAAGKKWMSEDWKKKRWRSHHPSPISPQANVGINRTAGGQIMGDAARKAAGRKAYWNTTGKQAKALAKNPKVAGLAGLTALGAGATAISAKKGEKNQSNGVPIYRVKKSKNIFLRRLTGGKKVATHPMTTAGVVEGDKRRR
jgi:hypothetical protein